MIEVDQVGNGKIVHEIVLESIVKAVDLTKYYNAHILEYSRESLHQSALSNLEDFSSKLMLNFAILEGGYYILSEIKADIQVKFYDLTSAQALALKAGATVEQAMSHSWAGDEVINFKDCVMQKDKTAAECVNEIFPKSFFDEIVGEGQCQAEEL